MMETHGEDRRREEVGEWMGKKKKRAEADFARCSMIEKETLKNKNSLHHIKFNEFTLPCPSNEHQRRRRRCSGELFDVF